MKRLMALMGLMCVTWIPETSLSQEPAPTLRTQKNEAFTYGETLKFRVHYGFMDAGEAILEVKKDSTGFAGRPCYHVVGTGRSLGAFDWFFKVRDRYESYVDRDAIVPWYFIRRVNEGGYIINQNVIFNQNTQMVLAENFKEKPTGKRDTIKVPEHIQDILSAFYYARTLDFSNAKVGDIFPIQAFLDNEIIPMNIQFTGRENVKVKLGTFRCLRFSPVLQEGRVFKKNEGMTIWITDDKNHIPVRAEAEILVGSIKMDLASYSGVLNPVAIVKKK